MEKSKIYTYFIKCIMKRTKISDFIIFLAFIYRLYRSLHKNGFIVFLAPKTISAVNFREPTMNKLYVSRLYVGDD